MEYKVLHLKPEIDTEEIAKSQGIIIKKANEADEFVNDQLQTFEYADFLKTLKITEEKEK